VVYDIFDSSIPDDKVARDVVRAVSKIYGCDIPDIDFYCNFSDDIGGDELDKVEFMEYIEAEFGIEIEPDEEGEFATVETTFKYIQSKLPEELPVVAADTVSGKPSVAA